MALYTMCFLCGEGTKTFLEIGPYDFNIVAYRINSKGGDKVYLNEPQWEEDKGLRRYKAHRDE